MAGRGNYGIDWEEEVKVRTGLLNHKTAFDGTRFTPEAYVLRRDFELLSFYD